MRQWRKRKDLPSEYASAYEVVYRNMKEIITFASVDIIVPHDEVIYYIDLLNDIAKANTKNPSLIFSISSSL